MTTKSKKSTPMCCLTINYHRILLPADAGMQVVKLLRDGFTAEYDYDCPTGRSYLIGDPLDVEFTTVRPDQLRAPRDQSKPEPARQRLKQLGVARLMLESDR